MTDERIRRLESIGFEWVFGEKSKSERWDLRYQELLSYVTEHGHTNVPHYFGPELGSWVATQRTQWRLRKMGKGSRLTDARVLDLDRAGMVWELRPRKKQRRFDKGRSWSPSSAPYNFRLQAEEGGLLGDDTNDTKEGAQDQMDWAADTAVELGHDYDISKEEYEQLTADMNIRMIRPGNLTVYPAVASTYAETTPQPMAHMFDNPVMGMTTQLAAAAQPAPIYEPATIQLMNVLQDDTMAVVMTPAEQLTEKQKLKKDAPASKTSPKKDVAKVDTKATAKKWPRSKGDDATSQSQSSTELETPWEQKIQALAKFKSTFGHTAVPNRYNGDPQLGRWVKNLRWEYKKKSSGGKTRLSDGRMKALNDLGFVWVHNQAMQDNWFQRYVL